MRLFDIEDYISKCGEDMIFAKCIGIQIDSAGKYKLKLQTSENEIMNIDGDELAHRMSQGKIKVINVLHSTPKNHKEYKWWYKWNSDEILDYCLLESLKENEEVSKAALKSNILGTSTYIDGSEEMQADNYKDLVVTDKATILNEKIRAKNVVFIGNRPLRQTTFDASASIMCKQAIIKNRCLFGSLIRQADVPVRSKRIYLSHEFIDINTVNEVLEYLAYMLDNIHESYADTLVYVDFAKWGISEEAVVDRTLRIIKDRVYRSNDYVIKNVRSSDELMWKSINTHESILPYMSLACSMYISTGYKHEELLEIAEICLEETFREDGIEENADELSLLKHLILQLYNGMRF